MAERLVFWTVGCEVHSGRVVFIGSGWLKTDSKVYDTLDTPDEARKIASELNSIIDSAF